MSMMCCKYNPTWGFKGHFPVGRPAIENAGPQFAADVKPFELRPLGMLNGIHSTLAHLGYLAGYEFVSDDIADPALRG